MHILLTPTRRNCRVESRRRRWCVLGFSGVAGGALSPVLWMGWQVPVVMTPCHVDRSCAAIFSSLLLSLVWPCVTMWSSILILSFPLVLSSLPEQTVLRSKLPLSIRPIPFPCLSWIVSINERCSPPSAVLVHSLCVLSS